LFVLGEGRAGAENFREEDYFWVDGNDKYSGVVRDSWTPETGASAQYPRLSSQTNSNNFRRSSYWLYSDDYFQIRKIQLTYTMPQSITEKLLMKEMCFFVNASDLFQFAKNGDIRNLNIGNEPRYRTFSAGI